MVDRDSKWGIRLERADVSAQRWQLVAICHGASVSTSKHSGAQVGGRACFEQLTDLRLLRSNKRSCTLGWGCSSRQERG